MPPPRYLGAHRLFAPAKRVYYIYLPAHRRLQQQQQRHVFYSMYIWYYIIPVRVARTIIIIIRCMRLIREKAKHSRRLYNYHTRNKDEKKIILNLGYDIYYNGERERGSRYQNYIIFYFSVVIPAAWPLPIYLLKNSDDEMTDEKLN